LIRHPKFSPTRAALAAALIAATGVSAAAFQESPAAAKATAPKFSLPGSDGKTHDLASLTTDTPCVFYFIKDLCPVNEPIVKYMNRLATAYGDKVKFVGVLSGDRDVYGKWQLRHSAPYTVLFDPQKTLIKAFKVGRSPESILVAKGGEIVTHWKGVSAPLLDEMSTAMARAAAVEKVEVDTKGAPETARQG
jgi:peroxiredoxin